MLQDKIQCLESLLSEQESKTISLERDKVNLEQSLTIERFLYFYLFESLPFLIAHFWV